jgi:uncharacterized membrane protein
MALFIAGLVLFLWTHLLRVVAPAQREVMIARLGPVGWRIGYSVVAFAGFLMMIVGYASIRWSSPMLWSPPPGWVRMAVGLVMLPVLVVFIAAYVPGRIRAALRHPMMIATSIWAALHLLVNGRVADLLLFGSFLAWALIVVVASFRRPWTTPAKPPSLLWDGVAIVAGLGAWWWLAFGNGHLLLFGVPVM